MALLALTVLLVDRLAEIMAVVDAFPANLMNSTVFLVETAQIIAVLFVNF